MTSNTHELIENANGTFSLRCKQHLEVMHSSIGPRDETLKLYIEQSKLKEKFLSNEPSIPVVVYDLGLGAGSNALASLQTYFSCKILGAPLRPLHLYSFENDLSGFQLAFEHRKLLPFFENLEHVVLHFLKHKQWTSPDEKVQWILQEGNFPETLHARLPKPEFVFFDFYSPKACPTLWTIAIFSKLHEQCKNAILFTYSSSTRVRVAMLLAGFYVGEGVSTGAKESTTVAATGLSLLSKPLDERWISKFRRSHARMPIDFRGSEEALVSAILRHPQFNSSRIASMTS